MLYNLAGQVVAHLRSYLAGEVEVENVLQHHQQTLVNLIHSQMQDHFTETAASYEANVTKGFRTLRPSNYTAGADQTVRNFSTPIPDGGKSRIGSMLFGQFQRCLYPVQKFDTDSERRFAVILENNVDVLKWFKPAKGDFQIHYLLIPHDQISEQMTLSGLESRYTRAATAPLLAPLFTLLNLPPSVLCALCVYLFPGFGDPHV